MIYFIRLHTARHTHTLLDFGQPPRLDRFRQAIQGFHRHIPVNARIGHRYAIFHIGPNLQRRLAPIRRQGEETLKLGWGVRRECGGRNVVDGFVRRLRPHLLVPRPKE